MKRFKKTFVSDENVHYLDCILRGCIHMSKLIKLYMLNMWYLLCVNFTSIKQSKKIRTLRKAYLILSLATPVNTQSELPCEVHFTAAKCEKIYAFSTDITIILFYDTNDWLNIFVYKYFNHFGNPLYLFFIFILIQLANIGEIFKKERNGAVLPITRYVVPLISVLETHTRKSHSVMTHQLAFHCAPLFSTEII